jgi:hypothetical protein
MAEWKFSLHSEALKVFLSATRTERGFAEMRFKPYPRSAITFSAALAPMRMALCMLG